ncbi:hypothetical protein Barb4_01648 [Bacteroidales bacterium Barb4]|nr:hypothetical protein Barb4_01648 [Bacteroidales bacterium Barb4]
MGSIVYIEINCHDSMDLSLTKNIFNTETRRTRSFISLFCNKNRYFPINANGMKAFAMAGFIFAARFTVPDRMWGSGKYIPAFRRNARFQPHMERSGMWGLDEYISNKALKERQFTYP